MSSLHKSLKHAAITRGKVVQLADMQRLELSEGFGKNVSRSFRMPCRTIPLKSEGLTCKRSERAEMTHFSMNSYNIYDIRTYHYHSNMDFPYTSQDPRKYFVYGFLDLCLK